MAKNEPSGMTRKQLKALRLEIDTKLTEVDAREEQAAGRWEVIRGLTDQVGRAES